MVTVRNTLLVTDSLTIATKSSDRDMTFLFLLKMTLSYENRNAVFILFRRYSETSCGGFICARWTNAVWCLRQTEIVHLKIRTCIQITPVVIDLTSP